MFSTKSFNLSISRARNFNLSIHESVTIRLLSQVNQRFNLSSRGYDCKVASTFLSAKVCLSSSRPSKRFNLYTSFGIRSKSPRLSFRSKSASLPQAFQRFNLTSWEYTAHDFAQRTIVEKVMASSTTNPSPNQLRDQGKSCNLNADPA